VAKARVKTIMGAVAWDLKKLVRALAKKTPTASMQSARPDHILAELRAPRSLSSPSACGVAYELPSA
jgi:hypothetical protein